MVVRGRTKTRRRGFETAEPPRHAKKRSRHLSQLVVFAAGLAAWPVLDVLNASAPMPPRTKADSEFGTCSVVLGASLAWERPGTKRNHPQKQVDRRRH